MGDKDFSTADQIRAELRAEGFEPDPSGSGMRSMPMPMAMPMAMPMMNPSFGRPSPAAMFSTINNMPYDAQLEAQLDAWQDARVSKNYAEADDIRSQLRSRGISPAKERPNNLSAADEIQQFHRAKQARDYSRSDRIRESLRKQGIDPDTQGKSFAGGGGGGGGFGGFGGFGGGGGCGGFGGCGGGMMMGMDQQTMRELSEWHAAKDQKNWTVADRIRQRM